MKVLSLFDGIGGARQALKELCIDCQYYASEIDKFAIQIAKANHPDIKDCLSVEHCLTMLRGYFEQYNLTNKFDLLVAGFPCQSFSIAGNRKGFEDKRGNLFFELLRILKEVLPKYFLLENVASMSKENRDFISGELGVEPIMINSALLTAQSRKRLYWTNIPDVDQPYDKGVQLKDIIENANHKEIIATQMYNSKSWGNSTNKNGKAFTLRARRPNGIIIDGVTRILTPIECERLQGFPDGYCNMVSKTQGYKALGNSFTVPVIKHILKKMIVRNLTFSV